MLIFTMLLVDGNSNNDLNSQQNDLQVPSNSTADVTNNDPSLSHQQIVLPNQIGGNVNYSVNQSSNLQASQQDIQSVNSQLRADSFQTNFLEQYNSLGNSSGNSSEIPFNTVNNVFNDTSSFAYNDTSRNTNNVVVDSFNGSASASNFVNDNGLQVNNTANVNEIPMVNAVLADNVNNKSLFGEAWDVAREFFGKLGKRMLGIISSVLLIIFVLVSLAVYWSWPFLRSYLIGNINSAKEERKISIDTSKADPQDVEQIKKITIPQSYDSTASFYSTSLDILIKYPSGKGISLSDSSRGVILSYRGSFDINGHISVGGTKSMKEYMDYYKSYYSGVEQISEGELEDLGRIDIISKIKSPFSEDVIEDYRVILIRNVTEKNKDVILDFKCNKALIDNYLPDLAFIVKNAVLNPDSAVKNEKIGFDNGGVVFEIDRSKWALFSHYPESSYSFEYKLSSISVDVQSAQRALLTITKDPIWIFDENENIDFLKQSIETAISVDNDLRKNHQIVMPVKERQIQGKRALEYKSKFEDYDGVTYLHQIHIEYRPKKYILQIKLSYKEKSQDAYADFEKIVNNIQFDQKLSLAFREEKSNAITIDKAAIIGKPSTIRIFNRTCIDINVLKDASLPNTGGKQYKVCSGGYGSGFFVNKEGYFITNAHVATPDPEDMILYLPETEMNRRFLSDFYLDLMHNLSPYFGSVDRMNSEELQIIILTFLLKLIDSGVINIKPEYQNYVIKYDSAFRISQKDLTVANPDSVYATRLVDHYPAGSIVRYYLSENLPKLGLKPSQIFNKPDLALLKIEGASIDDFPVMKLADHNTLMPSQNVVVIGYPGVVDKSGLFSAAASNISTLTKGTISAIKPNANNAYKLIQIDATVSSGNSGGPILNLDGEVVGVATYSINPQAAGSGTGNYNAGVSVEEVTKFLQKNNISNQYGRTSENLEKGLEFFAKQYYKLAIAKFNEVMRDWPAFVEVLGPLVNIAQKNIEAGNDKSHLYNEKEENKQNSDAAAVNSVVVIGGAIVCCVLLIIFVVGGILLIISIRRRRKGIANKNRSLQSGNLGGPSSAMPPNMHMPGNVNKNMQSGYFNNQPHVNQRYSSMQNFNNTGVYNNTSSYNMGPYIQQNANYTNTMHSQVQVNANNIRPLQANQMNTNTNNNALNFSNIMQNASTGMGNSQNSHFVQSSSYPVYTNNYFNQQHLVSQQQGGNTSQINDYRISSNFINNTGYNNMPNSSYTNVNPNNSNNNQQQ